MVPTPARNDPGAQLVVVSKTSKQSKTKNCKDHQRTLFFIWFTSHLALLATKNLLHRQQFFLFHSRQSLQWWFSSVHTGIDYPSSDRTVEHGALTIQNRPQAKWRITVGLTPSKLLGRGWRNSSVGKALAVHIANVNSIPQYCIWLPNTTRSDLQRQSRDHLWFTSPAKKFCLENQEDGSKS